MQATKWVIAAGTMIGFAFLAKMMQAFLVLPAFGLVYLVAAPTGLRRRLAQLLAGALAIVVSCGWWVAIVALWPASSRPMIDGSPDNNIFNLIFGYNGLGRIFGSSGPGGGGGGGGTGFSGATGPLRLFDELMGAQASWLLPAALLALVVGLWHSRRAPRTDRTRAALLLWGGWLLVTAAIFSFGQGVIHTYYTVALVPAIAALIAITGSVLWRVRETARREDHRGDSGGDHDRLVLCAARSHAALGSLAAPADRSERGSRGDRPTRRPGAATALASSPGSRGRVRPRGLPCRARRVLRADDHDRAHRVDPLRGTGELEHGRWYGAWRRNGARWTRERP